MFSHSKFLLPLFETFNFNVRCVAHLMKERAIAETVQLRKPGLTGTYLIAYLWKSLSEQLKKEVYSSYSFRSSIVCSSNSDDFVSRNSHSGNIPLSISVEIAKEPPLTFCRCESLIVN